SRPWLWTGVEAKSERLADSREGRHRASVIARELLAEVGSADVDNGHGIVGRKALDKALRDSLHCDDVGLDEVQVVNDERDVSRRARRVAIVRDIAECDRFASCCVTGRNRHELEARDRLRPPIRCYNEIIAGEIGDWMIVFVR